MAGKSATFILGGATIVVSYSYYFLEDLEMAEAAKITHVAETAAVDANDPGLTADAKTKIVAKCLRALAAKLDADAGVTDTNYLATIDALSTL